MPDYVLSCSSTADMPEEFFRQRNIPVVFYRFVIDGQEYADDLGQSMPFAEFYARIKSGAMPSTSQVNVSQYIDFFDTFLQAGQDVLHIEFSSGLSGSGASACIARDELKLRYPDRNLVIVDSLAASSGYGLLVSAAADMRDRGADMNELHNWLEYNKLTVHHWFFSTDLSHYRRGGRISAASAFTGNLLNICPLMNMDNEGRLIPRKKIHGKKRVIYEIVRMMEENAANGVEYSGRCYISNSACMEDARAVADLVESKFPRLQEPVMINSIGTVIGSHTGPDTVALFFFGTPRSD